MYIYIYICIYIYIYVYCYNITQPNPQGCGCHRGKLADAHPGPTETGKRVLRRISQNKVPHGLRAWPDEEGARAPVYYSG